MYSWPRSRLRSSRGVRAWLRGGVPPRNPAYAAIPVARAGGQHGPCRPASRRQRSYGRLARRPRRRRPRASGRGEYAQGRGTKFGCARTPCRPVGEQRCGYSSPPQLLDAFKPCEFGKGLSAVAAQPAVIVAQDVEAVAIDRALDPRGRDSGMISKLLHCEARSGITTINQILRFGPGSRRGLFLLS